MSDNIIYGTISSSCSCEDTCNCEKWDWEYWEETVEPFLNSSEHFYHLCGNVAEITTFQESRSQSRNSKAYGYMQNLLNRTHQYIVYWKIENKKLTINVNALNVTIIPCTVTCCAVCGHDDFVMEQSIMDELNWHHPELFPKPVWHNGVPFCKSCEKYFTDKYVLYFSNGQTASVNMTDTDADFHLTNVELFSKDGESPSPQYTLSSVGKLYNLFRTTLIDGIDWV